MFKLRCLGSILDLIQKTDNCDLRAAVKIVREFTSEFANARNQVETVFRPLGVPDVPKKTYSEESYKALENALKNSPEARKFLESRGISMEVAKRLRIGFRQDVGKLAGELGVSVSGSGWIVFPTFSAWLMRPDNQIRIVSVSVPSNIEVSLERLSPSSPE